MQTSKIRSVSAHGASISGTESRYGAYPLGRRTNPGHVTFSFRAFRLLP